MSEVNEAPAVPVPAPALSPVAKMKAERAAAVAALNPAPMVPPTEE
jgi:hypothetical protein